MKNFTLQRLGFLAFIMLVSCALLTAQEKRGIAVVKKINKEDGTVVIEKDQLDADALLSGYLKKEGKIVGNDVEIHLADAKNANIKIEEEAGETLVFVRSASNGNKDVERVRIAWHEDEADNGNYNFNYDFNFNDHNNNGEKNATGRTILGVYTDDHADVKGLRISGVSEGKGAEAAGLQRGDIITMINGQSISDSEDLRTAIGGRGNGEVVSVTYLRDGKTMKASVALTAERLRASAVDPCEVFIGVGTNTNHSGGVTVNYVIDDTPAAKSSIRAGDVILALDGNAINSQTELERERDKHQPGETFTLTVLRGKQEMLVNARFKECSEEELQQLREEREERLERRVAEMRERNAARAEGLTRINTRNRVSETTQRPILGVYTDENGSAEGLRLSSVSSDKGAKIAGLRGGDVLMIVDGQSIKSTDDLRNAISDNKPGEKVTVQYLRNGERMQAEVMLSSSTTTTYSWTVERDPCDVFIGIYSSSRGTEPGVRVTGVIEGTSAKKYGVQRGDVIIALDDVPVNNHNEVVTERDRHEPGEWYTLSILRDGQYTEIEAQFNPCDNQTEQEMEEIVELEEVADAPAQQEISDLPQLDLDAELKVEAWRMYPNPTVGILNVQFQAEAKPTTLRITDTAGKVIYNEVINQFNGEYNNRLNLGSAAPGTYILTVQQEGKVLSKKIVLMPKV